MANAIRIIGMTCSFSSHVHWSSKMKTMSENRRVRFCPVSASATTLGDPFRTLRIRPDASKSEVKKAFRQLALQYHPDVCRGNNSGVQFHHINEAYDIVMSKLRGESTMQATYTYESYDERTEETEMGIHDPDFDLWEEWMGWEGAGIRDYSSHINPYL